MFGSTFGAVLQGFGGNYNLFSDGLQCNADLFFTVSINVGRVEKRYAALETMPHNGHPVFNAQRYDRDTAKSYLRHHKICFTQPHSLHKINPPWNLFGRLLSNYAIGSRGNVH
jgi:hypothetical protein